MKQLFCGLCLVFLFACEEKEQTTFTVSGQVKNASARSIYLELNSLDNRPMIVDSAQLGKDGTYKLDTESAEEAMFSLRTDQSPFPFAILINDSRNVTVNADLSRSSFPYTVEGSPASKALVDFESGQTARLVSFFELKKNMDSLSRVQAKDSVEMKRIDSLQAVWSKQYEGTSGDIKTFATSAIRNSKSPMFILYALGSYQARSREVGEQGFTRVEMRQILEDAVKKFPEHTALLEQRKKLGSSKAPEISLPDTSGKMVSLSSFKGKYVLVDFWASWCKPCRLENPNIVAAWNQFRDKNFAILGVSLDKERGPWLDAIQADRLAWTHISDLQFWNSAPAQTYGVSSIPYNVLVDPEGNIIAEGLHGQQLASTLRKYLK